MFLILFSIKRNMRLKQVFFWLRVKKKKKKKITKCREKMAWATIEIILLYSKTNSYLSSTIEKVVYSV